MDRKIYRSIAVAVAVILLSAGFLAFYSIGVIDRADTRKILDSRVEQVCEKLDANIDEYTRLSEEIYTDYKSKTRVFAIMLSEKMDIIEDETFLEELRIAAGADNVSITDENGIIKYSTDPSKKDESAMEEFMPAIENKVFSEALISGEGGNTRVITGCSRLDSSGIIQIEFSSGNAEALLDIYDISRILTEMPVMKTGYMAIMESDSFKIVSHTDSSFIGTICNFPREEFESESGSFSEKFRGEDVMVNFARYDKKIVLAIVSYDEIYERRNTVIKWIIAVVLITAVVVILTVRSKILIYKEKEEKK